MKHLTYLRILLILILCTACEGSTMWREKHGLIKEYTAEFEIQSIRVDDDAEYHITAVNKSNGRVKSISDADCLGYVNDEISIRYSNVLTPTMEIIYDDRMEAGYFTEVSGKPHIVTLPYNFKIDTFDD